MNSDRPLEMCKAFWVVFLVPRSLLLVVVALALVITTFTQAFAAYTAENGDKAIVLNKLELYAGTSSSTFEPSLETALTAKYANGSTTVIEKLVAAKLQLKAIAIQAGLIEAPKVLTHLAQNFNNGTTAKVVVKNTWS